MTWQPLVCTIRKWVSCSTRFTTSDAQELPGYIKEVKPIVGCCMLTFFGEKWIHNFSVRVSPMYQVFPATAFLQHEYKLLEDFYNGLWTWLPIFGEMGMWFIHLWSTCVLMNKCSFRDSVCVMPSPNNWLEDSPCHSRFVPTQVL
jgi:hypothetical protein